MKDLPIESDLEECLARDRPLRGKVSEAVRADSKRAVRVRKTDCQPRLPAALHLGADGSVDRRHGVLSHTAIVVARLATDVAERDHLIRQAARARAAEL